MNGYRITWKSGSEETIFGEDFEDALIQNGLENRRSMIRKVRRTEEVRDSRLAGAAKRVVTEWKHPLTFSSEGLSNAINNLQLELELMETQ